MSPAELPDRFDDPDGPVELQRLRGDLEALRASVAVLTQLVHGLGLDDPAPPGQPAAWIWTTLPPDEHAVARAQLTGWVDQVVDRYGLAETIPPCWFDHPPIVEELSALRAAWFVAYRPGARPDQAAGWHDTLDRVLARVRAWNRTGCTTTHRPEPTAQPRNNSFAAEPAPPR